MKLRHGKLLTNERQQLVRDYLYRRRSGYPALHTDPGHHNAYVMWTSGFERFMCRGLDDVGQGKDRHGVPCAAVPVLPEDRQADRR